MELTITKIPNKKQEKVWAVKHLRSAFNLSLKDAKELMDTADEVIPVSVNLNAINATIPDNYSDIKVVFDKIVRDLNADGYYVKCDVIQLVSNPQQYIDPLRSIASAAVIAGDYVIANPIIQLLRQLEAQQ